MTREKQNKSKMKEGFTQVIEFDKDISISISNDLVEVKGPKGESQKKLSDKRVSMTVSNNKLTISSKIANKKTKKIVNTFKAHINNLIKGVKEPFVYKLKICSGHFPMKVSVQNNKLTIQNFLGEKVPRVLEFGLGVNIIVEDDYISVESCSKELAGQTAASIEQLTRRAGYDTRIFQDGCHIVSKAGKEIR